MYTLDPSQLRADQEPRERAATATRKTQIVVVGGGAGGLHLAAKLGRTFGRERFDVILVERSRTHVWKPLLHEVAAGSLDANLDELSYRTHGHRCGYRFFFGAFDDLDRENRHVLIAPILDENGREVLGPHRIRYDYLVLAVGSVSNDFGTPGVREHCLFLDGRAEADRFRLKLLNQCLRVSRAMSADANADAHLRVTIVGGGATSVELAAELYNAAAGLKHYGLEVFDESRLTVTLIEAGPRILPALPEKLAEAARHELETLGVEVLTGMQVTHAEQNTIIVQTGQRISSDICVWAAGVMGPSFLREIGGLETNAKNQIVVRPTLQSMRDDRIFAIGDCCAAIMADGRPTPPRAQAAHQMAATAFVNLGRLMRGKPLAAFEFHDHGSLVSLSRYSTVGSLMGNLIGGRLAIEGRLARFFYVSLYRMHIIAIHGWLKGLALIVVGHVNQFVRPRLKVH